jgi:hypothetical protein
MRPEILHQKKAFVSSRGVEELECTVARKKIGGTSEFCIFFLLLGLITG